MENPRNSSASSTATPNLVRVPSSLGMAMLAPQASMDAQAIVDAATAAAVAAGPPATGEDMIWIPPHRPLVGGGAAAAFEALRHDYYLRQREEKMLKHQAELQHQEQQQRQQQLRRQQEQQRLQQQRQQQQQQRQQQQQLSGEPSGADQGVTLPSDMSPRQHFEMLQVHHLNLVNEMEETTIMMAKFQQDQLQHHPEDPNVAMRLLQQKQQQLMLIQQRMQQEQQFQQQEQLLAVAGAQAQASILGDGNIGGGFSLEQIQLLQQAQAMKDRRDALAALAPTLMQPQQSPAPKPLIDEEDLTDDDFDGEQNLKRPAKDEDDGDRCQSQSKRQRTQEPEAPAPSTHDHQAYDSGEDCSSDSDDSEDE